MFGQILRREELQIGGKHVGIGMNGRRSLRRQRSTWHCRPTKKKKKQEEEEEERGVMCYT